MFPKLTEKQINELLKLPNFCQIFHGKEFGHQVLGSEEHRAFLTKQLKQNIDAFLAKPEFEEYLTYVLDMTTSNNYKPLTIRLNRIYDADLTTAIEADTMKFNDLMKSLLKEYFDDRTK